MNLTQIDSPFLRFEPDEARPRQLWIVCSHVDIPPGKFAQSHVFARLPGCKLFVNCARNGWYQQGIGGGIDDIAALVDALAETAADFRRARVVGHSMGGYLALALQHLAAVEMAVVISPEPELMVPYSRSAINDVRPLAGWADLARRFEGRAPAPGVCLYGAFDAVDAHHVSRLGDQGGLYDEVLLAPHHHGVTEYLGALHRYLPLLRDPKAAAAALVADGLLAPAEAFGTAEAFADYYDLYRLLRSGAAKPALAEAAARRADWANNGYQSLRATALRRAGRLDEALEAARGAVDPGSLNADPTLEYAACLKRSRDAARIDAFLEELDSHAIPEAAKTRVRATLAGPRATALAAASNIVGG